MKLFQYAQLVVCIIAVTVADCITHQREDAYKGTMLKAITWKPNGGRFGDNLLSYSKAKWLSYTYNIPLLYLPFPYSDQLMIHEHETMYTPEMAALFSEMLHLPLSSDYMLTQDNNILYISHWKTDIVIDWFDDNFVNELKKTIAPRWPLEKVFIPVGCVSIAAHVRNGGSFAADNQQERDRCPLRFVPDEFFIAQIARLAEMFEDQDLYVHIFTDHSEPALLMEKFERALNNPRISFGCRVENNSHKSNVLEDFFSMMDFNCLIRPGSHYSRFVQRLGRNSIVIYPESVRKMADGKKVIDVINIKTRVDGGRWKTKKVTII